MADHYLGALKEIERRAQNNILVFSDVLSERLDVVAENMVANPMSDNDFLKLYEMYYTRFSKEKNTNGMLFCLMRMQQVIYFKEHKDKQNERIRLEFGEGYDSITKAFLSRKRNYYQIYLDLYFKFFIVADTAAYVVLLMLFVLLFHVPFKISFIVLMICWALVLVFAKKRGIYSYYEARIQELSQDLNRVLLKVDQGVFSKVE